MEQANPPVEMFIKHRASISPRTPISEHAKTAMPWNGLHSCYEIPSLREQITGNGLIKYSGVRKLR
jgi:hypothetical protein